MDYCWYLNIVKRIRYYLDDQYGNYKRLIVISHGSGIHFETDLNNYFDNLDQSGMSLMIYQDDELIFQSRSKGIRPHLEAIEKHGKNLKDTVIVDKIVGRAAALLILYNEPKEVYAALVSKPGKQVLQENGLKFTFKDETDQIKMKDGRIFCPFERMVQGINDPEEAYTAIVEKMKILSSK